MQVHFALKYNLSPVGAFGSLLLSIFLCCHVLLYSPLAVFIPFLVRYDCTRVDNGYCRLEGSGTCKQERSRSLGSRLGHSSSHLGVCRVFSLVMLGPLLHSSSSVYPPSPTSPLHIALTDTFSTSQFLDPSSFTPARARAWRGLRQDSGDPIE